nr:acyltransferase [Bacteroidales bacterium]
YHTASRAFFEQQYGAISDYIVLGLLPSYLERNNSSLVYMVEQFIHESRYAESGFFLRAEQDFLDIIAQNTDAKIFCIGVSFALLDVAEHHTIFHPNLIVMETGGMKGRKKELVRADLHKQLQQGFQVPAIHSEYGMTELLSQSYAQKDGIFTHPAWMKILIRDMYDPFSYLPERQSGGMNIIDLANLYSCSFIETQDIGKKQSSSTFTVEGRIDAADVRGCSLLV